MASIYVIGSINNDVVVESKKYPSLGETVHGTSLREFPGGKGANQAVAAARAGSKVCMVGLVGNDKPGERLRLFLEEDDVDTSNVRASNISHTGTAIVTLAQGDNAIVVIAGANGALSRDSINKLNFESEDIVIAQFETPLETTILAFAKAKEAGAITILNPAPAAEAPQELLDTTDFLVVNEHEFETVFDQILPTKATERDALRGFGGTVIVTLGEDGVRALHGDQDVLEPGIQTKVVDTTGAGDCFIGYFADGLLTGLDVQRAIKRANIAAALSVTKMGAASSIPFKDEVARSMR